MSLTGFSEVGTEVIKWQKAIDRLPPADRQMGSELALIKIQLDLKSRLRSFITGMSFCVAVFIFASLGLIIENTNNGHEPYWFYVVGSIGIPAIMIVTYVACSPSYKKSLAELVNLLDDPEYLRVCQYLIILNKTL